MTIYIAAPANRFTGGPTLAHQLCEQLRSSGFDACMYYYHSAKEQNPVHKNYAKFGNPFVTHIKDLDNQILVVPETAPDLLKGLRKTKKVIWWMSVDNYFDVYLKSRRNKIANIGGLLKYNVFSKQTYHFAQSHYAIDFLIKNGVDSKSILYLSDFVDDVFYDAYQTIDYGSRNNQIVYSPKRGLDFTKKIIHRMPEYSFVALSGMTQTEMIEQMKKSKVYIDFGNHPGKDRIPREAAMCGCCIITGYRGSAGNKYDIMIDDEFKFNDNDSEIDNIVLKIKDIISNYSKYVTCFDTYRDRIVREKEEFINDAVKIFSAL